MVKVPTTHGHDRCAAADAVVADAGQLPLPWADASPRLGIARRLQAGWVQQRAKALLAHAHQRSAYYRRHHAGWQPADGWAALPPVHKADLMVHFDDWVTDPRITLPAVRAFVADPQRIGTDFLGRYAVWLSSGTTGEPGLFLHDGQALATYATLVAGRGDAGRLGAGLWQQMGLRGGPAVLLVATQGHYAGISFWQRQARLRPGLAAPLHQLSVTRPLPELIEDLNRLAPIFLSSYPSMLSELAEAQGDGRLHIRPALLWAGGEALADAARQRIEQAFEAPLGCDYGSSEMLVIACECAQHHLHVNDDWVLLEPVDEAGRPVPPGRASHSVLISNWANRVQPFIRYDLGDSITVATSPCPCGDPRPTITVQGRCDDVLQLAGGAGQPVRLTPMTVATVVEQAVGRLRFQVRQSAADTVSLRLALADSTQPGVDKAAALAALRSLLDEQGLRRVRLRFDPQAPQAEAGSGKLRQVVRDCKARDSTRSAQAHRP